MKTRCKSKQEMHRVFDFVVKMFARAAAHIALRSNISYFYIKKYIANSEGIYIVVYCVKTQYTFYILSSAAKSMK